YAGREPIFDLARVESTAPDGKLVTVTWEGVTAPAMAAQYTEDGGHLNALGRARAAREFIAVLARASQKIEELAAATRLSPDGGPHLQGRRFPLHQGRVSVLERRRRRSRIRDR